MMKLVSTKQACEEIGIGSTKMAAVKRQLGITSHKVFTADIVAFLRKNPTFTEADVYPLKNKPVKA